jgi:poly(A) polymerase
MLGVIFVMISKFFKRIFAPKVSGDHSRGKLAQLTASTHGIHRNDVSSAAIKTCEGLHNAGFKGFLVGGCVRDAMLGKKPKDFDIATDATPEQVTKIFRRSRIIGRRFQIVHVMWGREVIEVTTFRGVQENAETDEHGRLLRDNLFGSMEDDARRRDFTVNALYYDPQADVLLDYHGGVADMKSKLLRVIGDPATRYREDPVRMLRSARFAAKLGFTIEPKSREPIAALAKLIQNIPPARLFDEMLKLLTSGHAMACLKQLRNEGLHHGLLPLLDIILEQPQGARFVEHALARTDERVRDDKSVSPSFLFACLLWPQVTTRWAAGRDKGEQSFAALMQAIDSVLDDQADELALQKRIVADIREIWTMQPRFERRQGATPYRLLEHLRFRSGYDFMLLRSDCNEIDAELAEWWTEFHVADDGSREDMIRSAPAAKKHPKPVVRQGAKPSPTGALALGPEQSSEQNIRPIVKRRRRRRGSNSGGDSVAE